MNLRVQCYSGWKDEERPVRFQLGERDYMVEEVIDQWYGGLTPGSTHSNARAGTPAASADRDKGKDRAEDVGKGKDKGHRKNKKHEKN